jgi:hypothetical protein
MIGPAFVIPAGTFTHADTVKLFVELASSMAGRVTDSLELPSKQTLPLVAVKD